MTLSMFFKDVKFELLNEFVVLIFAYNLLYENKRHFVGTWDIYIYPQKVVVCSLFRNACFWLLMDSEWKPWLFFHLFPLLKFPDWMWFTGTGLVALCSGRSRSTYLFRCDH